MRNGVYSVNELKDIVAPIAAQHGVARVFLFGSYARGSAEKESDIDLRVDKGDLCGYFALGAFYNDLEDHLGKKIDLLTTGSLDPAFLKHISYEEVELYDRAKS